MTNEELQRLHEIEAIAGKIVGHYDTHRDSGLGAGTLALFADCASVAST
jgi:hypothetical protein